jgi:hypothetical protein
MAPRSGEAARSRPLSLARRLRARHGNVPNEIPGILPLNAEGGKAARGRDQSADRGRQCVPAPPAVPGERESGKKESEGP